MREKQRSIIAPSAIDLHQKRCRYLAARYLLTQAQSWKPSTIEHPTILEAGVRTFSSAKALVVFAAALLLFGASAYSFELNGAWASDPSICSKIFVKQNTKLVMTSDADNYGSGFVVDGNQVRGKIATCNIKSRKEEAGLVHLITSCSTDVALQTVQLSFKVDDDNRITRIFPGAPEMSVSYSRCPTQ